MSMKPEAGNTSVGFGKAFIRPAKEKDHFELMRPLLTVRNEGDRVVTESMPEPVGPIAIYRIKGKGDKSPDMRDMVAGGPPLELKSTNMNGQPIDLILVWWPGKEEAL
jgi:hypothetical protein